MHLKRWLTGIIATPFLIYVIGFGPRWVFHLLLLLVAVQGLREFYGFACPELPGLLRWMMFGLALSLFVVISRGELFLTSVVIFLWAAVPMSYFMFTHHPSRQGSSDVLAKAVLAPLYICIPLSLLMVIDRFPRGNIWVFFLLLVVFANDTGAFYVGRAIGRHKLHPSVSPGKTWEGALGGWLASVGAALFWSLFFRTHPFDLSMAMLATGMAVSGQIGDLAESMLKRYHGVKDSGGILPGHGGILDRIDGLLFSVPLLYVFLSWSVP